MSWRKQAFLDSLCEFITREQGRGFAMETWRRKRPPGTKMELDEITREFPKCGTVACIGGSIQSLRPEVNVYTTADKLLGLNRADADLLFYDWKYDWPEPFRTRYEKASTTEAKAEIAVDLLREAVRTAGKCLHSGGK